ncbi:hypothetical protein DRN69_00025 [Candidatus Pacearchaeota archaeon]|nr:MAG: hypothetical protein DRN69_00025 [Candidatus Pacearchaeota archaeon]
MIKVDNNSRERMLDKLEGSLEGNCEVMSYWNNVIASDIDEFMKNAKELRKKEALVAMNEIRKSCYIILATLEDVKRIFYDYYDLRKEGDEDE